MIISNIKLQNYRNYEKLDIDLGTNMNIFIGDNAQGKTNFLESIYVLGLTKSYLSVNDRDLILKNNIFTKINGTVVMHNSIKKLEVLINSNSKKVKINDFEIQKMSNYISNLNVIAFTPDTFIMVKEGPNLRRKYLNIEISQINSRYLNTLINFNYLLKQRNEYLKIISKSNHIDYNYLNILNEKYATLAVELSNYRYNYIFNINKNITKKFKNYFKNDTLILNYISNVDYNEDKKTMINNFISKLNKNFEKEKLYKQTIYGPHRDDFLFLLNDKNIVKHGSQGQIKIALFVLKLVELEIFYEYKEEYPILLLDDILSELDHKKVNLILKKIPKKVQIIMTTPDIKYVDKSLLVNTKVFKIKEGKISINTRRCEKNAK